MRILVISNSEWDDGNSFGSTFSNILSFEQPDNIANIYCRNGKPSTKSCGHFFSMGEKDLLNKIFKKNDFEIVTNTLETDVDKGQKKKPLIQFIRTHRWIVFFWAREFLWSICPWKKSQSLDIFLKEFSPDIIVLPTYGYSYINKLALHISKKYNVPIVSYISDDEYSLHQRSWSPLYWINRLYQRIWIKKGFNNSKILYTISNIQNEYYKKIVKCPCKVLTKGLDFSSEIPTVSVPKQPIRLFYAGNIGSGRWRSLKVIADAIEDFNQKGNIYEFNIYTGSPISDTLGSLFNVNGVHLNGFVHPNKIKKIIEDSDILVHAESFKKADRLAVRQSFSTKIVDYLHSGKCIIGIGPIDVASIEFLLVNNAAIIIKEPEDAISTLRSILDNPNSISEYANNAWDVGKMKCDISMIHTMLKEDFDNIIKQNNAL